ncbi:MULTISPECIES: adaptor protein MecA [Leuconostoc]|uniref:Adapter protein MecA n=2 Tax=Leuconostoc kimchii TaxID=136609 RepID=D5T1I7_LEUKI|nr:MULTISPECIES: adaptor protein MecA [Leuconostoc]ADG40136.1 adaptor protein [Leuconostoc kimchii IMSNU 11154]AEJ30066.1 adaptor protein [Leuconostoc sp. C2]QBR47159.1 adaptor protein MecA [Leuconostoc kimchii]
MEMERINENTIRVMIENNDLKERGISVMDLLGNHDKIESFFYNILSEVDVEHDFGDDDQVSFQILPNRNGLELFISRIDDENQVGDAINNLMAYAKHKDDETDDVSDERKTELRESDDGTVTLNETDVDAVTSVKSSVNRVENKLTLKLSDLESLISISQFINGPEIISNLYRYDSTFYLSVQFPLDNFTDNMLKDQKSLAFEFATESDIKDDVLREHGEVVINKDALEKIKDIF